MTKLTFHLKKRQSDTSNKEHNVSHTAYMNRSLTQRILPVAVFLFFKFFFMFCKLSSQKNKKVQTKLLQSNCLDLMGFSPSKSIAKISPKKEYSQNKEDESKCFVECTDQIRVCLFLFVWDFVVVAFCLWRVFFLPLIF